ncbi:polysaccharide deacetylase family protein [Streptomyces aureoversilis]|uniref:Polysaccharide deacetylase family protein n=1 Tax=Streptomyces aureoversilis TaxID=67277 RepID=A0ABW0A5I7_9ACTN
MSGSSRRVLRLPRPFRPSRVRPPLVAALAVLTLLPYGPPASAGPAAAYDHQRCGNTSGRVLLTLDDWPYDHAERAVKTGAYLEEKGIRAAFFLINQYASQAPQVVRTLRRQGHWVGNHTYSHPHLTNLPEAEARKEIRDGVRSTLLRPPFGDYGPRETRIAASLGYRVCTWTVDTRDWENSGGGHPDVATLRARVRDAPAEDKRGGVVLGHLFSNFPDALPGIVDDLRTQGYALCRNTGPTGPVIGDPLRC